MKFDRQKAFPYPVLRPESDDYKDVDFQATVEPVVRDSSIQIEITFAISSEDIVNQINKGNAEYVSIVSCRDTYFRKVLSSTDQKQEADINIGALRGEVRVDPYIVVRRKIKDYLSAGINPEFGKGPFQFSVGDVLAQDEPQVFYIDRDLFKPVTSVFDLVKRDGLSDGEWTISFDEPHVQIEVSPKMKQTLDDARNSKENKVILLNSLYFSAVMQAVQKLKDSLADFQDRKWAEVITRQAHNKGCDLESHDAYIIAERLMQYPLSWLDEFIFKGKYR